MRFVSTRSSRDPHEKLFTFEEALLSGYAPNGGMIMPAVNALPQLTSEVPPFLLSELSLCVYVCIILIKLLSEWNCCVLVLTFCISPIIVSLSSNSVLASLL